MLRKTTPLLCALAIALSGCSSSGGTTSPNGELPNSTPRVDTAVLGTWAGIPGTASSQDTARITADSLVSTWTFAGGGTTHNLSIYPVKLSGAWFYARAGQGGKAGQMGTSNGQTVRDNVIYEYMVSKDTLFLELESSDQYDTIVDRTSPNTHALLRQN